MDIDYRIGVLLLPLLLALGWAGFNIAPAALRQLKAFLDK